MVLIDSEETFRLLKNQIWLNRSHVVVNILQTVQDRMHSGKIPKQIGIPGERYFKKDEEAAVLDREVEDVLAADDQLQKVADNNDLSFCSDL